MNKKPETKAFIGIDLGTTNSVISNAVLYPNGSIKVNPVDIERTVGTSISFSGKVTETRVRRKTLPSCVYYNGTTAIVGDYAKELYKKYPGSVVKSVKSQMGQPSLTGVSSEVFDKTPEQVSARILMLMKKKAQQFLSREISNAIITVPANFDAAQREATIKAAELAGFSVTNPDGTRKPILISEPNAVLYDLMQKVAEGEIANEKLDFSTKKKILVFDIGGGTLDVTFHEIEQDPETPEKLNISEIATSRYTRLAGDDFDEKIANVLFERCIAILKKYDPAYIKQINRNKEMVLKLLKVAAEQLKIDMSMRVANKDDSYSGWFDNDNTQADEDEDFSIDVSQIVGDEKSYNDSIKKSEFEEMLAPLMGNEYTFDDYKGYSSNTNIDKRNIIAPILDVLEKAARYYKLSEQTPLTVDVVVLNGGMSKLYLIKDRLTEFFGFEPITVANPDLSVANGAAVYACLYSDALGEYSENDEKPKYKNLIEIVRRIQTDTLYLGLAGGATTLLVEEGTELPFSTEIYNLTMNAGNQTIEIPIKRAVDKGEFPVIARGRITFPKSVTEPLPLKLEASVDTTGLLSVNAVITNDSGILVSKGSFELALGDDSSDTEKKGSLAKILPQEGAKLDAVNYIHMLTGLFGAKGKKTNWATKVNQYMNAISACSNPSDFESPVLAALDKTQPNVLVLRLLQIAADFAVNWTDDGKKKLISHATYYNNLCRDKPDNTSISVSMCCKNILATLVDEEKGTM